MESEVIKKFNKISNVGIVTIVQYLLLFFISTFGLYLLSYRHYFLFHSTTELFSAVISFGIFMFSVNTYKISKNDFFRILGTGYLFVGIFDICHALSYSEMQIFPNASSDMVAKFWLSARVFELVTLLISTLFLYKKIKNPNYYIISSLFLAAFIFHTLDIIYFNIFPVSRIAGIGQTQFKLVFEYIITFGYFISIFIFYKSRKFMDKSMFFYLELSIILSIVCEICTSFYKFNTDFVFSIGHIVKVISFYCMYKGILANGLLKPFDTLIDNLDQEEKHRKYIEEAIFYNEQCYDLIINRTDEGIIIHSDGKFIFANSTAVKTLGAKDISSLIGKEIWNFIDKDYLVQTRQRYKKLKKNRISIPFAELKLINSDGKTIVGEAGSNYIMYRRKPAILTVLRGFSYQEKIMSLKSDIIESEKKLDQSNEYNRVLTEFFTNISHELKTPLNIILGTIQLLQQPKNEELPSAFEEKLNKYLKIMKQNSFRLIRLINNLIDISKYDSRYLNLNKHNYNIVSIAEDITLSVRENYKSSGINIIFDTDAEEKIMAVDDDKFERILLNLLSNAVKFTDKGGEILVNFEDKDDFVRISVKDTGIGIPSDKLELIFDRFGQVDKTLIRNREGSGIGLSLVKTLTEMHGGSIKVNSTEGKGSEFIVDLPVTIIEDEEPAINLSFDSKIDKIHIEFSDIYSDN